MSEMGGRREERLQNKCEGQQLPVVELRAEGLGLRVDAAATGGCFLRRSDVRRGSSVELLPTDSPGQLRAGKLQIADFHSAYSTR